MTYRSKITESDWKYPAAKANREGELQVCDDPPHKVHWEEYGNPQGEPVMVVHGGPGGACSPDYARFFDPERYRIILFDQRGCGKSTPSAADADATPALTRNTTDDLMADMNRLRGELGIAGKMHLFGGSWGSTLSLAYAISNPENVQSLNLRGIFLCRKQDLDYFYQGNAETYAQNPHDVATAGTYQCYPEAWEKFVETIPEAKRGDMVKAYAEIFAREPQNEQEREMQDAAATAWSVWEGSTSYLAQDLSDMDKYSDPTFAKAFAKIENHYFMNGGFLGGSGEANRNQNFILENLNEIKDIPISVVHGRYDQVCPLNQGEALVAGLEALGAKVDFRRTPAGHSMMERETHRELTDIMDNLPLMHAVDKGPISARSRAIRTQSATERT